jgi:deazaflavin-dependent oxidoreductase (nitroreductase family)
MDATLRAERFCYLTTTGRRSGQPRRIEIWFAAADMDTIYLLAGHDRAGWVRNVRASPAVTVQIGDRRFSGTARIVEGQSEDAIARRLVYEKYRDDDDLETWRQTALPVAIDLRVPGSAAK